MIADKERLDIDKETVAIDKLKIDSQQQEIEKAKKLLLSDKNEMEIKESGMKDLSQMLKLKQEKLKTDQVKIDKYLSGI